MATKLHYWISSDGFVSSTDPVCPVKKPLVKMKYIGFTSDFGWPKTMNTGRVFYKPVSRYNDTKKLKPTSKKLMP